MVRELNNSRTGVSKLPYETPVRPQGSIFKKSRKADPYSVVRYADPDGDTQNAFRDPDGNI